MAQEINKKNIENINKNNAFLLRYADEQQIRHAFQSNYSTPPQESINYNPSVQNDLSAYGLEFIDMNSLVKIPDKKSKNGFLYMIHSKENNRHIPIESNTLYQEYAFFIRNQSNGNYEIPEAKISQFFFQLTRQIPFLAKSGLNILPESGVMFLNGFYDLHNREFVEITKMMPHNIFNEFSLEFNFPSENKSPVKFDMILSDMFDGDENKIRLAYQFIGAILSPGIPLKNIFVFQGKSQGGKTLLSETIKKLLPMDDTDTLDTLAQITNAISTPTLLPRRLIYVKEVGKKSIPSQQIASLKSAADGTSERGQQYKILLNTNYGIYTGDPKLLEPALRNRLIVLPFPKPMDHREYIAPFKTDYFENEKPLIARKALEAFADVIANNNEFSYSFEINTCIENENAEQIPIAKEELHELDSAKSENQIPKGIDLSKVLDDLFDLQDEINPNMTAEIVKNAVNQACGRNRIPDNERMGKALHAKYGNQLKNDRIKQNTCYNLTFRSSNDSSQN